MKDRVVVRTQDFGADGVHVARFPDTDGPMIFPDELTANDRGYLSYGLMNAVVMDVATATNLERKAEAYDQVCKHGAFFPDPDNIKVVIDWLQHARKAMDQVTSASNMMTDAGMLVVGNLPKCVEYLLAAQGQFSLVRSACVRLGWDPDQAPLTKWIAELSDQRDCLQAETATLRASNAATRITIQNQPMTNDKSLPTLSKDREAAVNRITATIESLTKRALHGPQVDCAGVAKAVATLETVLATYLH